jgi:hypothetical protein
MFKIKMGEISQENWGGRKIVTGKSAKGDST